MRDGTDGGQWMAPNSFPYRLVFCVSEMQGGWIVRFTGFVVGSFPDGVFAKKDANIAISGDPCMFLVAQM